MKGAILFAREPGFMPALIQKAEDSAFAFVAGHGGILISADDGRYLRIDGPPEKDGEIPAALRSKGYAYSWLVEGRDEAWFCEVLAALCGSLDVFVWDTDEQLFRAADLDPKTIRL